VQLTLQFAIDMRGIHSLDRIYIL